jgi:hypothetical protein
MEREETTNLVALDYCRAKYGVAFWESLGRNPANDEFYVLWYFLTEEERQSFLAQVQAIVRGRR